MDEEDVDYLGNFLDKSLLDYLKVKKINKLFPVQKFIIPLLINQFKNLNLTKPHDYCISSPTGSGKTYAFCLPIIQFLSESSINNLCVLIILPVTDLALQVYNVIKELCEQIKGIYVSSAIGDRPLKSDLLSCRSQILVATPGKLIELITNVPEFSLKSVKIVVIDEVDRILNSELEHNWIDNLFMSLYDDHNRILNCNCSTQQHLKYNYSQFNGCCLNDYSSSQHIIKLLFSATLNTEKTKLDILNLFEPLFFNFSMIGALKESSTKYELPITLKQRFVHVSTDYKPAMLVYLLKVVKCRKIICFVGSKDNAHRLNLLLNKYSEFNIYELSSQIEGRQREKLKNDFSQDKIDLIICTDILARGIDIQDVNYVINYEPPLNVQTYVHRVGRTARAGKVGTSITLIDQSEMNRFRIIARKTIKIRKLTKFKLNYDRKKFKEIKENYVQLLESLKTDIIAEKKKKKRKRLETVNNLFKK